MRRKLTFSLLFWLLSISSFAQKDFWEELIPDETELQYAGSIGFLSLGAGYELFKNKANLSLHLGYVPESLGGELTIIAVKFQYKPFKIPVGKKIIIHPFNPVFFPSYTLGQNFDFRFEKPKYKEGYYFWSSALRVHLGASTAIKLLQKPEAKIKALSLFAEANTNDLYAISWFHNRTTTPFYRMFRMGYGLKMHF